MQIKNIITKLLSGSEINALERAELEACDPDKLVSELAELRSKISESEREKLGEKERLELDIAEISRERDELKASHDRLLRLQSVRDLASRSRFTDPDYLDYLAAKENVDLNDKTSCEEFIEKIRISKPHSFEASVQSGSGTGTLSGMPENSGDTGVNRIGKIISGLENISFV